MDRARDIVADPQASCEDLVEVFRASSNDPDLRQAAISHAQMTERAIESIFLSGGEESAAVLALCDRPRLLMLWALAPRASVRAAIAANPHTPTAVLEELFDDPDATVRESARLRQG